MGTMSPVKFRQKSGVVIAKVAPETVVDARTVNEIGDHILAYVEAHPGKHMILDFSRIEYISSAVFEDIVRIRSALEQTGATLRVCIPSRNLRVLFKISGVNEMVRPDADIKHAMDDLM